MNILLFTKKEISSCQNETILLDGDRAKHIAKVLRSEEGDSLRFGVIDGGAGEATVLQVKRKYPHSAQLKLRFDPLYREKEVGIDLLLALPRPIMLRRILSQVTALGVGRIFLVDSARVEKSFWQSSLLEKKQYEEHLRAGLEQAVATQMPTVEIYNKFSTFFTNNMALLADYYAMKILADPAGEKSLAQTIIGQGRRQAPLLFAIGPEGGWIPQEREAFAKAGFLGCSLGSRILKVDTAVVAVHSQIRALQETLVE